MRTTNRRGVLILELSQALKLHRFRIQRFVQFAFNLILINPMLFQRGVNNTLVASVREINPIYSQSNNFEMQ